MATERDLWGESRVGYSQTIAGRRRVKREGRGKSGGGRGALLSASFADVGLPPTSRRAPQGFAECENQTRCFDTKNFSINSK